jgi:hypothetical protein
LSIDENKQNYHANISGIVAIDFRCSAQVHKYSTKIQLPMEYQLSRRGHRSTGSTFVRDVSRIEIYKLKNNLILGISLTAVQQVLARGD